MVAVPSDSAADEEYDAAASGAENVRGRIGQVKGAIMVSTSLPTDVQMRQLKELQAALPKLVADSQAAAGRVPALAKNLISANLLFAPVKQP